MSETPDPTSSQPPSAPPPQPPFAAPQQAMQPNRLHQVAAWVVIAAGISFIMALVLFLGLAIIRNDFFDGYSPGMSGRVGPGMQMGGNGHRGYGPGGHGGPGGGGGHCTMGGMGAGVMGPGGMGPGGMGPGHVSGMGPGNIPGKPSAFTPALRPDKSRLAAVQAFS